MNILQQQDPDVFAAIAAEEHRQQDGLEMIASENYTSVAVMEAVGSVLTNKYAEGYPGRRYYGGCEHVDVVEDLARNRAKQLFGAEAACFAALHQSIHPGGFGRGAGITGNQHELYQPGCVGIAHGGRTRCGFACSKRGANQRVGSPLGLGT